LRAGTDSRPVEAWLAPREVHLLKRVLALKRTGERVLELREQDLTAMSGEGPLPPLPHSFSCMVELEGASPSAVDGGPFRILFHGAVGPSAARMFGRFCHGDPGLSTEVRRHLEAEELLNPNAIHAEIAHLPEGRMGNVLARPLLRSYEIPYLGSSGADSHQWVLLEDLFVGVVEDRVVLWSRRLDREVLPRLSSAAAYNDRGSEAYRFLASLQDQGVQGTLGFQWGNLAGEAALPRVVSGRVVLARAQWRWGPAVLAALRKEPGARERFLAIQRLRREQSLPRHLVLPEGDNELPVDLDNALCVEAFWGLVKQRESVILLEDLPDGDNLVATGPDGPYRHQLILAFLAEPREPPPAVPSPILSEVPVHHAPGSEWLYAKIYTGMHSAAALLGGVLGSFVQGVMTSGDADRWFFLRYADPDPHIRLRFHGTPDRIWGRVFPGLRQVLDPNLANGSVWRLQLDTYEPETLRYGGLGNQERTERIFMADSDAALGILAGNPGAEGERMRWCTALASVDAYFTSADLSVAQRLKNVRDRCAGFDKEFPLSGPALGQRFREVRKGLEALLDQRPQGPRSRDLTYLEARTARIRPILGEMGILASVGALTTPMDAILASLIHMSVNRLLSSAQRAQEAVIYHMLARLYEGRLGRARTAVKDPPTC